MFNIVLFEPEIPPNTGNIIRLAANTGCKLHLIKPLGFDLEEKKLRRAGLDYHEFAELKLHESFEEFKKNTGAQRVHALTTKASKLCHDQEFKEGDFLLFGPETRGLPTHILEEIGPDFCIRIPMLANSRSLNLSNATAIILYSAWAQLGFKGGL